MATDFTYNPSNDIGRVRFKLGDHREEGREFSDTEISQALADAGSVDRAVGELARVLLMSIAKRGAVTKVGPDGHEVSIDPTATIAQLERLVEMYGGASPVLPKAQVFTLGRYPSDPVEV